VWVWVCLGEGGGEAAGMWVQVGEWVGACVGVGVGE
jgi:hypothetical protein